MAAFQAVGLVGEMLIDWFVTGLHFPLAANILFGQFQLLFIL